MLPGRMTAYGGRLARAAICAAGLCAGVLVPYTGGTPQAARVVHGTNGLGQTVCSGSVQDCVSAGAVIGR